MALLVTGSRANVTLCIVMVPIVISDTNSEPS